MQEVALDHVPEGAGSVVVAGAAFQGQVLVKDDLHFFDVLAVPDGFQEPVGEAKAQDVQHRGFAQEMVHAVDVVFGDQCRQRLVQLMGGFLARAEGLLHDQAGPGRDLILVEYLAGLLADVRRQGEVDGDRALQPGQQLRQRPVRRDIELVVSGGCPRRLPVLRVPAASAALRGRGEGAVNPLLPLFLGPGVGARPHQLQSRRPAGSQQSGESGQQQPACQVPGRAEDEQRFYSCFAGHCASMPSCRCDLVP